MTGFAQLAAGTCPAHEVLALGLAEELGDPMAVIAAAGDLAALAASLPPVRDADAQLLAVADLAACTLRPRRDGSALLPEVLRARGGDPLGIAVALAAAAARAGYATGLVGHGDRLYVAHPDEVLIVDPLRGVVDARVLGVDLEWRCAHESSDLVLRRTVRTAERAGDLALALAASALLLVLPVDEETLELRRGDHKRLLSRLN